MSEEPTPAYHLQKAREREHILVAIVLAQRDWRRVIEVVETAATTGEAQIAIQQVFSLTPHQAMAVMDIQVRRVVAVERDKITDDLAKVRADIQELEANPALFPGPSEWEHLPTSGADQSCAFCGTSLVSWVHPLDRNMVTYRKYGKGHTLPSFWCTCDECDRLLLGGDDEQLIERMQRSDCWEGPGNAGWSKEDIDEVFLKPLDTFRRSNLGSVPLAR